MINITNDIIGNKTIYININNILDITLYIIKNITKDMIQIYVRNVLQNIC